MLTLSYNAQQNQTLGLQKSIYQLNRNPGCHTPASPIAGTRSDELATIRAKIKTHPTLAALEYELHDADTAKDNFLLIPSSHKQAADRIAKELFENFISIYEPFGITAKNAIDWNQYNNQTYQGEVTWSCGKQCHLRWDTHAHVHVATGATHDDLVQESRYNSHYIVAIHELQHVEEWNPHSQQPQNEPGRELLTSLQSVILTDIVYKRIFGHAESTEECYMGRVLQSQTMLLRLEDWQTSTVH